MQPEKEVIADVYISLINEKIGLTRVIVRELGSNYFIKYISFNASKVSTSIFNSAFCIKYACMMLKKNDLSQFIK